MRFDMPKKIQIIGNVTPPGKAVAVALQQDALAVINRSVTTRACRAA